jgi:hypothetical protein
MEGSRWVAALAICPDDIESIAPNFVTATLKNGEKIQVPVYMINDESVKRFDYKQILKAYNEVNKIEEAPEEEYHGAD